MEYHRSFLEETKADTVFAELMGSNWNGITWERRSDAPRYEFWTNTYGRPYTYGNGAGTRTYESQPCPRYVDYVRSRLAAAGYGVFEGCFLNGYADSRDSLGWHSDDDPGIDHSRPIAVVSLGEARMIEYKPIDAPNSAKKGYILEHGSLFLMKAGMQHTHVHRIPKASFIAKPRISMTYRGLLPQA